MLLTVSVIAFVGQLEGRVSFVWDARLDRGCICASAATLPQPPRHLLALFEMDRAGWKALIAADAWDEFWATSALG